jgi:hypothetical protein
VQIAWSRESGYLLPWERKIGNRKPNNQTSKIYFLTRNSLYNPPKLEVFYFLLGFTPVDQKKRPAAQFGEFPAHHGNDDRGAIYVNYIPSGKLT